MQLNGDHYATIIVADAPTLGKSEQNPSIRVEFYNQLNNLTSAHKNNKHRLLVIGDFNAKTSSAYPRFSESIDKFGKGISSCNGEHLLEQAMQNNLVLPNTLFPHKMTHKTTWTLHERVEDHLSFNRTSSVKTCTKSFCRNQDHMVEQERKLIKNWLKLLLN